MPDWLSSHGPVLANTIGHCAGAAIFGTLLWLFFLNWLRAREDRSILPALAAALGLIWNIGSLVALASGAESGIAVGVAIAVSFSALSLLPAVLLHISVRNRYRLLWIAGYGVCAAAVLLHIADVVTRAPGLHYAALLVIIAGFGTLTVISVVLHATRRNRAAGSRLAAAMVLFLLAVSFAHFGPEATHDSWVRELLLHHAALPLALFILLQDYRFLLLDAFLRFVVSASFAAGALLAAIPILRSPHLKEWLQRPFTTGIVFACACLALIIFAYLRNRIQAFLTRAIFLRSDVDAAIRRLQYVSRATHNEADYLSEAAAAIAEFFRASRFSLTDQIPDSDSSWDAVLPIRFSAGDVRYLRLGRREGGRRYLSEDFTILQRLASTLAEHVEQLRSLQMQNLVTQAELKALQSQINPHFLFNSLTTLYGTIDRNNDQARRMVMDLSNVFRHLLRAERTFIEVVEEVRIVRSYLDIEAMRLGSKLTTDIDVDDSALILQIPMLSIQPLVENAVKHGVAARKDPGFVQLRIAVEHESLVVVVSNSGECDVARMTSGAGIGLANVRRRLMLCYGPAAGFNVDAGQGVTRVGFTLPLRFSNEPAALTALA